MYSTCIFCNESLGSNEVVEHFPVGRRLAFDAAKGRLWVVCRSCERWNLTPIEERWEAIEECERLFADTRLRASTDNIGLAKLREGLELVRIGSALRPEMAAWRYGDQFGRRRRKHLIYSGAAVAGVAGLVVLGPVMGVIAGGGWGTWQLLSNGYSLYQSRRVRVRLKLPGEEQPIAMRNEQLVKTGVVRSEGEWGLCVTYKKPGDAGYVDGARSFRLTKAPEIEVILRGEEAIRAAGKLLPAINEEGAKPKDVQTAVSLLAGVSDPARLFDRYAAMPNPNSRVPSKYRDKVGHVAALPSEVRLALEMAAHEEQERRALEGELALLETAWREAEEVAHIADNLFTSADTDARIEKLRTSN